MRPHCPLFPPAHRPGRDARGERAELRGRGGAAQTGVTAMNDSSTKSPDGNKPSLYEVGYALAEPRAHWRLAVSDLVGARLVSIGAFGRTVVHRSDSCLRCAATSAKLCPLAASVASWPVCWRK